MKFTDGTFGLPRRYAPKRGIPVGLLPAVCTRGPPSTRTRGPPATPTGRHATGISGNIANITKSLSRYDNGGLGNLTVR
jgi:hypothetical protein